MNEGVSLKQAQSKREADHTDPSGGAISGSLRWLPTVDVGQIVALALAILAVAPLTYPGFFQSHSGFLAVYNLYDLERHAGPLGLGWMPTVGQALDPLRGGGALPYVVAQIFAVLGMTAPQAVMASYGLSFLVGTWAMYRWVRCWLGRDSALLAAVLYTYMPYHLMSVYVRGSLADAWILALLPLTLWATERREGTARRWTRIVALAVAFALLCWANLGLAFLWLPILTGYACIRGWLSRRVGAAVACGAVLAIVGIAYACGVLAGMPDAIDGGFPYLFQFLSTAWNAGGLVAGWLDGIPLQIGLAGLGLGLLAVVLLLGRQPDQTQSDQSPANRRADERARSALWFWLIIAAIAFLLMLSPSRIVWQLTGWDRLLTYPWQVMAFPGLALAVVGGSVVALDERLQGSLIRAGLVTFVILASYNFLVPRFWDFDIDFTPEGKTAHVYSMPPREAPLAILGDNQIALLDLEIEGPLRHGATIRANVLWQALRPLAKDYKVFVHVVDADGNIRGQRDSEPLGGADPTSQWGEGDLVPDRYELGIDLTGPREGYSVEVGMYDPDTGERLPLSTGDTKLVVQDE